MGKYFEDFREGAEVVTRGRTVTEADIMQYAGLCWDTQREHTNAEFARKGPFGERIAQQQLGLLIAHGLIGCSGVLDGTLASVLRLSWNFFNPMKIGDTLHVKMTVVEKKDVPVEAGGLITFQLETVNHREQLVNRCRRSTLVARRPGEDRQYRDNTQRCPYVFLGLSELEPGGQSQPDREERVATAGEKTDTQARILPGNQNPGRGRYFEEFTPGEELITEARTVAEADVINYTMLSWDTDPLHTDAESGRASVYGGVVAPVLLPIVFANGLGATLGFLAGTNRGALGAWWEFIHPVRVGDTLRFRQVVNGKNDAKDQATGIVSYGMEMINQEEIVVSRGQRSALVARLSEGESKPWSFSFGTPGELAKGGQS